MFGRVPIELKPDVRHFSVRENKYPPPEAGIFDPPTRSVCINQEWIPFVSGVIEVLETGQYWEGDEETWKRAQQEIWKLMAVLAGVHDFGGCNQGDFEDTDELCNEYTSDSFIITYAPNDPFQTPDLAPDPYQSPPWVRVTEQGSIFPGSQENDAVVGLWSVPIDFGDWLTNPLGIVQSGLPRFRVHFTGQGTVELHLLAIPHGGLVAITIDSNPLTTRFMTLTSVGFLELEGYITTILNAIVDALPDDIQGGIDGEDLIDTQIVEIPITEDGSHHIDLVFLPIVNEDVVFGFGGGLRKVVLCRENITGVPNQMPEFRVNQENFNIEWKPNTLTQSWAQIGQVIYPLHMRVETDELTEQPKIQYTLQPLEIGGGADPFEEWVDLLDLVTPQFRTNSTEVIPFVEWKLAGEDEWTKLFDLPRGILDVVVNETLVDVPPSATYEPETELLTLNLPPAKQGTPAYLKREGEMIWWANSFNDEQELIWTELFPLSELTFSEVYIEMEDSEDAAFLDIQGSVLTFHIPKPRDFQGLKFQTANGWLQWDYSAPAPGTSPFWKDLIPLADITGADGQDGINGQDGQNGIDGQDGDRILQVIANTLAAGSAATVSYDSLGGILYFGIPRGDHGIDGNCDCEPTMPYATGMSNNQRRCNIATGLNDWLFAQFQALVVSCSGVSDDLTALQLMFGIIPQSEWEQTTLFNLAGRFRVAVVNDVNALLTTGNKELMQEWMYCNLPNDAILDPPTVTEYLGEIETILGQGLVQSLYADFVDGLKFSALDNQAAIASYQTGDCSGFDCGGVVYDWCYEFDFVTAQNGFGTPQGYEGYSMGQYSAGVGYITTNADGYIAVYAAKGFGSQFDLGAIEIASSGTVYALNGTQWILPQDYTAQNFVEFNANVQRIVNWEVSGLFIISSNTITKLRLWGMGENPFGESNC